MRKAFALQIVFESITLKLLISFVDLLQCRIYVKRATSQADFQSYNCRGLLVFLAIYAALAAGECPAKLHNWQPVQMGALGRASTECLV